MPSMLPDGFEWRSRVDTHDMWFSGRPIAQCTQVPNGRWRVTTGVSLGSARRTVFKEDAASARAYVERWVLKWEDRLRHEVIALGTRWS